MNSNNQFLNTRTDYQHPKCYARDDCNCSTKISKEHFISETLLRQIELDGTAKVAGLKWQPPEAFSIIPLRGLASNVLCERHNSALSPLDRTMGQFAESIGEFDRALGPSVQRTASELRSYSGIEIERWMLKCVVGLSASRNIKAVELKPECIDVLFGRIAWPEGWGLYFSGVVSQPIYHSGSFRIETLTDPGRGLILACRFVIRGLPFFLSLGKPDRPEAVGVWRPAAITFRSGECEKTLALSWAREEHSESLVLTRSGTYNGPPPDWKEWERTG